MKNRIEELLGAPECSLNNSSGSTQVWISGNILISVMDGTIDTDMANAIVNCGNKIIDEHGEVLTFHAWKGIKAYKPESRAVLVDWTKKIGKKNPKARILLKMGIVSMSVTIASLVLKNIVSFTDEDEFFSVLKDTLRHSALHEN